MANLSEKLRRFRRFVRLNVLNFIVIGISIVGAISFAWGVFHIVQSPVSGMTVLYGVLIVIGGFIFHRARLSERGRISNLIVEDED